MSKNQRTDNGTSPQSNKKQRQEQNAPGALSAPEAKLNRVDPALQDECRTLQLSPPWKDGRHLSYSDIVIAIDRDNFTSNLKVTDKKRALIWLYGRKYLEGEHREDRKKEIQQILDNDNAMARLTTILEDSWNASTYEPDDIKYDDWVQRVEDFGHVDGAVSAFRFKNYLGEVARRVGTIVLRWPLISKNCFLHAPAILHCYLLQWHTGTYHGVVDLRKYICHYFCDAGLSRLVIQNLGGDSQEILESLTGPVCYSVCNVGVNNLANKIIDDFNKHGPALVSRFEVDETMKAYVEKKKKKKKEESQKYDIPLFDEYTPATGHDAHAMVLVGHRPNETGDDTIFLLQNSWKQLLFLEVTSSFLKASKVAIMFVTSPIAERSDSFPMVKEKVGEAHSVLEGCDTRTAGCEGSK